MGEHRSASVSVLFNEPKLLKLRKYINDRDEALDGFSALQRAEIAEISKGSHCSGSPESFSALQRAEIAEIL